MIAIVAGGKGGNPHHREPQGGKGGYHGVGGGGGGLAVLRHRYAFLPECLATCTKQQLCAEFLPKASAMN